MRTDEPPSTARSRPPPAFSRLIRTLEPDGEPTPPPFVDSPSATASREVRHGSPSTPAHALGAAPPA